MKKSILTIFAAFVLSALLPAQNNNLVIYSQEGLKFTLILNGVRQNAEPQTNVKVTGLNAPNYQVKVIFANGTPDVNQNVYLMDGGNPTQNQEFSSAIVNKKGTYKLQFRSIAPIEAAPIADPQQTVIVYNPAGYEPQGTTITQHTVETTTNTVNNGTIGVNIGVPGVSVNMNVGDPGYVQSSTTTTTVTTTTNETEHPHHPHPGQNPAPAPYTLPGYNGIYGCPAPMSPGDFENAKKSIASKGFDDSKLTIAKQIIGSNCMLCQQIKELMLLMSFEESKLDLAKFAWQHNLDKGNYYTLNDAFGFESSIDELNTYTQSH